MESSLSLLLQRGIYKRKRCLDEPKNDLVSCILYSQAVSLLFEGFGNMLLLLFENGHGRRIRSKTSHDISVPLCAHARFDCDLNIFTFEFQK